MVNGKQGKGGKECRLLSEYEMEGLVRLVMEEVSLATDISTGTRRRGRRVLPPPGSVTVF